jgi:hypothetical protein
LGRALLISALVVAADAFFIPQRLLLAEGRGTIMREQQSYFSIVLVAIAVMLTLLAIIVVFTTPVFGQ